MLSRLATASAAVLVVALLAGCTAAPTGGETTPTDVATPAPTNGSASGNSGPSPFPPCDVVATAVAGVVTGLEYNEDLSVAQTAEEAYEQRVCVFTNADASAQVGITYAAIPFQQTELDAYSTLPNAIADDRLAEHKAVLQTLKTGDADDGHLDSALYLFDEQYSITIQGYAKDGGTTAQSLPQLSVAAATDAAFAARALVD